MMTTIEIPVWLLAIGGLFAAVTFASHFLFPSVRWYFRRRAERLIKRMNERLERPIEPFKLARRYDMIQRLIYDRDVIEAVNEHAEAEGVPDNVAFQLAERYAREIVPSFSAFTYFKFGTRLARFLSRAFYRVRLGHYADALKDVPKESTVIFIMNHRSNMDYVLVTYLAAERSALSYAVGEWARIWPLSRLIRMLGAYFIRRKSRNPLYRRVLSRYVQMATAAGVTQAIFPEGGLSLDGGLAPPRMGLLNYVVSGYEHGGKDVVFVPVAINYDRVLEDRILISADKAGVRRFKASVWEGTQFVFRQIKLRVTGRYFRFGYAAVSFGEPLSMGSYGEDVPTTETVAAELMARIADVMPVLPVPLVSEVLLNGDGLTREELQAKVETLADSLPHGHVHLPRDSMSYAVEVGMRMLLLRKLVQERDGAIFVHENERDTLAFYARSISHLPHLEIPRENPDSNKIT